MTYQKIHLSENQPKIFIWHSKVSCAYFTNFCPSFVRKKHSRTKFRTFSDKMPLNLSEFWTKWHFFENNSWKQAQQGIEALFLRRYWTHCSVILGQNQSIFGQNQSLFGQNFRRFLIKIRVFSNKIKPFSDKILTLFQTTFRTKWNPSRTKKCPILVKKHPFCYNKNK